MTISRKVFGAIAATALTVSIAACTPPNQNDSTEPKDNEVLTTSQAPTSATSTDTTTTGTATSTTAAGETEVEVEVSPSELVDGNQVKFTITGLDPDLGYYAAICAAEAAPGNPVPVCTGIQADLATQAWISNSQPGATDSIETDGSATVSITAAATGEGIDCTTDNCVAKVFGDHTEGFRDVAEVPVSFAAS